MSRLRAKQEPPFDMILMEVEDPKDVPDAIAGLADAVLEHGRLVVDAAATVAAAIEKAMDRLAEVIEEAGLAK